MTDIIRFESPFLVSLYVLLPVVIMVFLLYMHKRKKTMQVFGQEKNVKAMAPLASGLRHWYKFCLLLLAMSITILAAMGPQTGSRLEEATREGVDIIVALDVSRSMLAEDVRPTRLERAKMAIGRLVDQLDNDRIGLVVFAASSHVQVPLTADHHAVKMLLNPVNTQSVAAQGTLIESALDRAMGAFPEDHGQSRIIILISDGESHDDNPRDAATRASDLGIVVHTVGIGSRQGSPIPVFENGRQAGYLRDADGNTVISRYDEQTLREIASITGGIFRHGAGADMGLNEIMDTVREMEQHEFEKLVFAAYENQTHYLAALALLFLLAELFIMERKNKFLQKIRIFGSKN